jgi:hypothetical protein
LNREAARCPIREIREIRGGFLLVAASAAPSPCAFALKIPVASEAESSQKGVILTDCSAKNEMFEAAGNIFYLDLPQWKASIREGAGSQISSN